MPSSDTWITPANAREMSAKANAAKAARLAELRDAVDIVKSPPDESNFTEKTLARVRLQMASIQTKLEEHLAKPVLDSKAFKELTEAFSRLEIAEQKLSGRHAPGSYRPTTKSSRSDKRRAAPIVSPESPVDGQ